MSDDAIRFYRDDRNFLRFETRTGHLADLGAQLVSDIQAYAPDAIDLLARIDEVASGRSESSEFEGNSAIFRCHADGVLVESLGPMAETETYSFTEARTVVRQYLDFLAPSPEERERHKATWEKENGRPFPRPDWVL